MKKLFLFAILLCATVIHAQSVKSQALQLAKDINAWIAASRTHEPKPANWDNPKWPVYGIQLRKEWDTKFLGRVTVANTWLFDGHPPGACTSEYTMAKAPDEVFRLRQKCADKILQAANKLGGK